MKETAAPRTAPAPATSPHALAQADQRPAAVAQRQALVAIGNSPRQVAQRQTIPATLPARHHSGRPNPLKADTEPPADHLPADVPMPANSDQPAQLQAHAYARGTTIHQAPGREPHLPHEAWHAGQPKQAIGINDDSGLELEAEAMGQRAVQGASVEPRLPQPAAQPAATTAVQRRVISETPKTSTADTSAISSFVQQLNSAMHQAYLYVLHVPELGAHANLDGYTERWVELYQDYKKNKPVSLMAAAFGYAIESLTTLVYLPNAPAGMVIELQGPRSGTRPDVILKRGTVDLAWLDLTADSASSRGHIWDKVGWQDVQHTAELGYPPLDLSQINPTPNYTDNVDLAAFKKREHWIKKQQEIRRHLWGNLRSTFQRTGRRLDPVIAEREYPKRIMRQLSEYFNVPLSPENDDDRATAASLLTVMGVDPKTWKLMNSVSRARGESFLLQHDPHLFNIEIPEDGLPQHLADEQERAIAIREETALREQAGRASQLSADDELGDTTAQALVPHQNAEAPAYHLLMQGDFTVNLGAINFQMAQLFGQRLDQMGLRMSMQVTGRRVRTRLHRVSGEQFVHYFGRGLHPTGGTSVLGKRLRDTQPQHPSKRLKTQAAEDETEDTVQVSIQLFATPATPSFFLQHFPSTQNLFAFLQQSPGPLRLTDSTEQQ